VAGRSPGAADAGRAWHARRLFLRDVLRGREAQRPRHPLHRHRHWRGDEHAGFYGEEIFTRFSAYHDARYRAFSRLIRSTFDEAVGTFADGSIDLLHIDGRHLYEDVAHDFETWRPKLSARAVVLFHDTAVVERNFGVQRLWKEVSAAYPHFQFFHGYGLGVLAYGAEQPQPLAGLCAAERTEEGKRIRSTYAYLGRAISDHFDLRNAGATHQAELSARDRDIEQLRRLVMAAAARSRS
jgi:hypothetical protein